MALITRFHIAYIGEIGRRHVDGIGSRLNYVCKHHRAVRDVFFIERNSDVYDAIAFNHEIPVNVFLGKRQQAYPVTRAVIRSLYLQQSFFTAYGYGVDRHLRQYYAAAISVKSCRHKLFIVCIDYAFLKFLPYHRPVIWIGKPAHAAYVAVVELYFSILSVDKQYAARLFPVAVSLFDHHSFNDLAMIRASKAGFLFRSTDAIQEANPDLPACETYEDLLRAITEAL